MNFPVFPWGSPPGVRHLLWQEDDGEKEEHVMGNVNFTCHSMALMSLFVSKHLDPQLEGIHRRQGPKKTTQEFACVWEFL